MFCQSFGSEVIHPLKGPTDLTRVETFPGAACLTRFAVMQRAETNIVGSFWCDPKRLPSRPSSRLYHSRLTKLEPQEMTLLLRRSIRSGGLSPEDIKDAVTLRLLLLPLLGSSLSERAFAVWFRTDIRFCL
jgi:hypothetical protein